MQTVGDIHSADCIKKSGLQNLIIFNLPKKFYFLFSPTFTYTDRSRKYTNEIPVHKPRQQVLANIVCMWYRKMKKAYSIIILCTLAFIALAACNKKLNPDENTKIPLPGKPSLGFNAKGPLETELQVAYTDKMLAELDPEVAKSIVIRVSGGTLSQKTYLKDWTNEKIQLWADLKVKYGLRYAFTINGNDTPENQLLILQNWKDHGVEFEFFEMMNEYWQNRYHKPDLSKPDVLFQVTPEMYIENMLPRFFAVLDVLKVPYHLICAPANVNEYSDSWNNVIFQAVSIKFRDRNNLGITLHMYARAQNEEEEVQSGNFDYEQIAKFRKRLPPGRSIAITESGVINSKLTYEELGQQEFIHMKRLSQQLQKGDFVLNQVLFNTYPNDNSAVLHPSTNGLTPKGKHILDWIIQSFND